MQKGACSDRAVVVPRGLLTGFPTCLFPAMLVQSKGAPNEILAQLSSVVLMCWDQRNRISNDFLAQPSSVVSTCEDQ